MLDRVDPNRGDVRIVPQVPGGIEQSRGRNLTTFSAKPAPAQGAANRLESTGPKNSFSKPANSSFEDPPGGSRPLPEPFSSRSEPSPDATSGHGIDSRYGSIEAELQPRQLRCLCLDLSCCPRVFHGLLDAGGHGRLKGHQSAGLIFDETLKSLLLTGGRPLMLARLLFGGCQGCPQINKPLALILDESPQVILLAP